MPLFDIRWDPAPSNPPRRRPDAVHSGFCDERRRPLVVRRRVVHTAVRERVVYAELPPFCFCCIDNVVERVAWWDVVVPQVRALLGIPQYKFRGIDPEELLVDLAQAVPSVTEVDRDAVAIFRKEISAVAGRVSRAIQDGVRRVLMERAVEKAAKAQRTRLKEQAAASDALIQRSLRTLGLHPFSTPDEAKRAFRAAVLEHHPDRGGDEARMKEINAAYDVLMQAPAR